MVSGRLFSCRAVPVGSQRRDVAKYPCSCGSVGGIYSILGYFSHMGAGSITSNVKSDKKNVIVRDGSEKVETGIKKYGAMIGDYVEVGCNAVCNPGTVIGRHSNVYPTSCVRGVVPADSIWKDNGEIIHKEDRD